MRNSLWIIPALLLLAAVGAPAAQADTYTNYTIDFTLTGGSISPTSGLFTYDDTANQFTSFTVVWDGINFDVTSAANSPMILDSSFNPFIGPLPTCLTATSGAAASLSLLTDCGGDPNADWEAAFCSQCDQSAFSFADLNPAPVELVGDIGILASPTSGVGSPAISAQGTWEVVQDGDSYTTTPEPGTVGLTMLGIGLVLLLHKRIAQRLVRQAR
jgi:hypothetical protein